MNTKNCEGRLSETGEELRVVQPGFGVVSFAENLALKFHRKFGMDEVFSEIQFKYKIRRVLYILFYWLIFSVAQDLYDLLVLSNYADVRVNLHVGLYILTNTIATFLGGLVGGTIIIFYLERLWRTKSVGFTLTVMSCYYTIVLFIVVAIGSLIYQSIAQERPFYHPAVLEATIDNYFKPDFLRNYLTWWLVVVVTIILLQVNDKYGPGVLIDLVFGNYHKPKSEERIFMFLDLRSSTATAEQLGEEDYFHYIRDFFMDTTDAILETKGEIYQYVGDEIVVSWKMKNGLERANALRCFFSIQQAIEKNKTYYRDRYNYVPGFKAGFHCGKVTTGEIGIVKKDITFTGDVLNVTSRIQHKCNDFGVDLLISNELLRLMPPDKTMQRENLGEAKLKGKESKMALSTVRFVQG